MGGRPNNAEVLALIDSISCDMDVAHQTLIYGRTQMVKNVACKNVND